MARNQRVFNGCCPNIPNLVANNTKLVRGYNEYASRVINRPTPATTAPTSLCPLNDVQIKISFDANMVNDGERGLGVVARIREVNYLWWVLDVCKPIDLLS